MRRLSCRGPTSCSQQTRTDSGQQALSRVHQRPRTQVCRWPSDICLRSSAAVRSRFSQPAWPVQQDFASLRFACTSVESNRCYSCSLAGFAAPFMLVPRGMMSSIVQLPFRRMMPLGQRLATARLWTTLPCWALWRHTRLDAPGARVPPVKHHTSSYQSWYKLSKAWLSRPWGRQAQQGMQSTRWKGTCFE